MTPPKPELQPAHPRTLPCRPFPLVQAPRLISTKRPPSSNGTPSPMRDHLGPVSGAKYGGYRWPKRPPLVAGLARIPNCLYLAICIAAIRHSSYNGSAGGRTCRHLRFAPEHPHSPHATPQRQPRDKSNRPHANAGPPSPPRPPPPQALHLTLRTEGVRV